MPKNKGKGGQNRRRGKKSTNSNLVTDEQQSHNLVLKTENTEYAVVLKALGDCRMQVYCSDGKIRIARVPGKYVKRIYFQRDDIILIYLRDYDSQDDKCDILTKYNASEVRKLIKNGHIPNNFHSLANGNYSDNNNVQNDDIIDFDFVEDSKSIATVATIDDEIDINNV